jgi:hypothetical protein
MVQVCEVVAIRPDHKQPTELGKERFIILILRLKGRQWVFYFFKRNWIFYSKFLVLALTLFSKFIQFWCRTCRQKTPNVFHLIKTLLAASVSKVIMLSANRMHWILFVRSARRFVPVDVFVNLLVFQSTNHSKKLSPEFIKKKNVQFDNSTFTIVILYSLLVIKLVGCWVESKMSSYYI